jgi:hypothetical protein
MHRPVWFSHLVLFADLPSLPPVLHPSILCRPSEIATPEAVDLSRPAQITVPEAAAESARAAATAAAAAAAEPEAGAGQPEAAEDDDEPTADELQQQLVKVWEQQQAELKEGEVPPEECRRDWRAALRWSMGSEGNAALMDPDYRESVVAVAARVVAAPDQSINPQALAELAKQQLQQRTAAAAATAASTAAAGVFMPRQVMPHVVLLQPGMASRCLIAASGCCACCQSAAAARA